MLFNALLGSAASTGIEKERSGLDALDAFMANIKSGAMDTRTKMSLKRRLFDLKKEKTRLEKLANVARPANVVINKSATSRLHCLVMVLNELLFVGLRIVSQLLLANENFRMLQRQLRSHLR